MGKFRSNSPHDWSFVTDTHTGSFWADLNLHLPTTYTHKHSWCGEILIIATICHPWQMHRLFAVFSIQVPATRFLPMSSNHHSCQHDAAVEVLQAFIFGFNEIYFINLLRIVSQPERWSFNLLPCTALQISVPSCSDGIPFADMSARRKEQRHCLQFLFRPY